MKTMLALIAPWVVVGIIALNQEKPVPPPVLTTEQKQSIQILAQRIELAQLRAQAAQVEFEKARTEIATLLQSLAKDGYDLDIQQMAYVKKPPKAVPK